MAVLVADSRPPGRGAADGSSSPSAVRGAELDMVFVCTMSLELRSCLSRGTHHVRPSQARTPDVLSRQRKHA